MRVTGGALRGRKLKPFKWSGTKPSSDKTRLALINILGPDLDYEQISVLDCFAGTGIVSLEFISRGAENVTSVEHYAKCISYMEEVKKELSLQNWKIQKNDVFKYLINNKDKFDIIFADPPYAEVRIQDLVDVVLENEILSKSGTFVLEHISSRSFDHPGLFKSKKYGETSLSFYRNP